MEKFEPSFENKVEKGNNVVIHAIFTRHAEKMLDPNSPETILSENGRKNTKEIAESRERRQIRKGYSSDTARTKETVDIEVSQSDTEKRLKRRLRKELEFVYDKNGPFIEELMRMKKDALGEDYKNLSEDELKEKQFALESEQTNYYLSFKNERPDPNTYSPVETASMMARLVAHYIKMSEKINSGTEMELINGTHDFNLITFLSQVIIREIEGKKLVGFEKVEEIGGPADFNEQFEVLIQTDDRGGKTIRIFFRDNEYEIDQEKFNELLQISKKLIDNNDNKEQDS